MNKKKYSIQLLFLLSCINICWSINSKKMAITRVILASNERYDYLSFWPIAATAWKKLIGVQPTLALVSDKEFIFDKNYGDVIYFKPIPNIPTSFQAQIIRLLLPVLFPNDVCIISDIDQIPVSKSFFCDSIAKIEDDRFVVYRECYSRNVTDEIPMCYNAAKGSTFAQIFNVYTMEDIRTKIEQWGNNEYKQYGWMTDQRVLYDYVTTWEHYQTKVVRFGYDWIHRKMHHFLWPACKQQVQRNYFFDIQLRRPFDKYLKFHEEVLQTVGLGSIKQYLLKQPLNYRPDITQKKSLSYQYLILKQLKSKVCTHIQ